MAWQLFFDKSSICTRTQTNEQKHNRFALKESLTILHLSLFGLQPDDQGTGLFCRKSASRKSRILEHFRYLMLFNYLSYQQSYKKTEACGVKFSLVNPSDNSNRNLKVVWRFCIQLQCVNLHVGPRLGFSLVAFFRHAKLKLLQLKRCIIATFPIFEVLYTIMQTS